MLSLISFILVCIGCINWFCIGILQFDFIAGVFGSQSNIFSRLIYTLVGVAAIVVISNFVTNKGRFVVSFKKANEEYEDYRAEKVSHNRRKAIATESADDFSIEKRLKDENKDDDCNCGHNCECDKDNSNKNDKNKQV